MYPLIYKMERDIYARFNCIVTVGFYAIDFSSKTTDVVRQMLTMYTAQEGGVVGFHGICVMEETKEIFFDVTFRFGYDYQFMLNQIVKGLEDRLPGYTIMATPDFDYSDGEYL